jgi:hypothetical protein
MELPGNVEDRHNPSVHDNLNGRARWALVNLRGEDPMGHGVNSWRYAAIDRRDT